MKLFTLRPKKDLVNLELILNLLYEHLIFIKLKSNIIFLLCSKEDNEQLPSDFHSTVL